MNRAKIIMIYEGAAADRVSVAAYEEAARANRVCLPVEMRFDDMVLTAEVGGQPEDVMSAYRAAAATAGAA